MNAALPTRSVLAATDLTPSSEPVLRAAASLCALTGATLHVIHAFDFAPSPYMGQLGEISTFQDRIAQSESDVRAQVARVVPAGVTVAAPRVEIYLAHRAIADYARQVEAELVVIGPHARREMELGFLGGTADRLLRTLEVPCLMVRDRVHLPLRHVLVPMDLSEWARAALDIAIAWGCGLAAHREDMALPDTVLTVLHVAPKVLYGPGMPFDQAQVLPGWNEALAEAAEKAANVEVRESIVWGDSPGAEIVAYAEHQKADLIVMSTHGFGAVKRALLGGTAHTVARRASCPVLMVPPRMWVEDVEAAAPAVNAAEMFAPPPV
jgi:nucleotide-binding universal stress UspA family protein